jgi:hypothetical protein
VSQRIGLVETSQEILLIIIHNITADGILYKGVKKCSNFACTVQICTTMHAHNSSMPRSSAAFNNVLEGGGPGTQA